jgi:two-component system response regulator YesN
VYKVLLADDEPMILKGLKRLINWDDYGLEITGVAVNGEDAWRKIEKAGVDILITDIRMPKLDGLELLKKISDDHRNIKTIVVSGYDDFSYVKQALQYGIENYILKPINEDELSSTLLHIIEKMDQEKRRQKILQCGIDTLRDNIIDRWLQGAIDENELLERAGFLGIDTKAPFYLLMVIAVDSGGDVSSDFPELLRDHLRVCQEKTEPAYFFFNLRNELVILAPLYQTPDIEAERGRIQSLLQTAPSMAGTEWRGFVGPLCTNPLKLSESYRDLKRFQAWRPSLPAGCMVCCADEQGGEMRLHTPEKHFRSHPLVNRMRRYVTENYADDISLKTLSQHFDLSASYMGQVFKQETGMLFTDYLCGFRIEKAKALLAEGLHKNYAVAGMVGFRNPNYFANVFKKKTGVYPSAYRNDPEYSGE